MRRLLTLALLASLLVFTGPARAQDGDQPNKLSLEALTAPGPGGGSGSYGRARHYARSGSRRSYAGRSYGRYARSRQSTYHRRYGRAASRYAGASARHGRTYHRATYHRQRRR